MDKLKSILELREMLLTLEQDVGLDDLSRTERDILLAAHSLAGDTGEIVTSDVLRDQALVQEVPQATFYRAVKRLLALGFLERAEKSKAKAYIVRSDLIGIDLPAA